MYCSRLENEVVIHTTNCGLVNPNNGEVNNVETRKTQVIAIGLMYRPHYLLKQNSRPEVI